MKKYSYLCNKLELVLLGLDDIHESLVAEQLDLMMFSDDNMINKVKFDISKTKLFLLNLELSRLLAYFESVRDNN